MAINLIVAGLHVLNLGAVLGPELRPLVSSYFSDLAIPFAFYFLLCLVDDRSVVLRPAGAKASAVLAACSSAELLQRMGIPALGRTFDPWDFLIYAIGVGLAATLDRLVLTRLIPAWPLSAPPSG